MSKTQTQSKAQTHTDDRSRGRRKSEAWEINESIKQQSNKEGGGVGLTSAGQGVKCKSHTQHHEAPAGELEKYQKNGAVTSSVTVQPFSNDYASIGPISSMPRPRRSSIENTKRGYVTEDPTPPYDSRHMFNTQIFLNRHIHDTEKRLYECMKDKKAISGLLSQTMKKLEAANARNEELKAQVQGLAEELELMKGQFQEAENRRHETARLLHETTSELLGAKCFSTKMDAMSETDVVKMVDNLNTEIMQTSALIADTLEELSRGKESEKSVEAGKRKFNRRALGNALIQHLEREGQSIDPMSVQLALQFCLAETCYVVVESWQPGIWKGEEMLFEIYESMKRTEIQSVVGRWRALTRAQTNYQETQIKVNGYFYRRVQDVLSLAGWPSHIPEHREFLERFKERIESLATFSLRLHQAVSKDMTSGELRVKMIYPEERYDPESIDQAFPDETLNPNQTQSEHASGTTDLGLVRAVGADLRTLRKPKIVLESALHVLLGGR